MLEPRISLVTLPVANLDDAAAFYEKMGLVKSEQAMGDLVFFQMNGMGLALYPEVDLADDARCEFGEKPSCLISHNVRSEAEVDAVLSHVVKCGGKIVAAATEKPWGYTGHFADLDGHVWEVAYVPNIQLDEDGNLWVEN